MTPPTQQQDGQEVDSAAKSREQIKTERKAKAEAAKAAKSAKADQKKSGVAMTTSVVPLATNDSPADTGVDVASTAAKSKAELKAERRAKQEAQRAAKSAATAAAASKSSTDAGRAQQKKTTTSAASVSSHVRQQVVSVAPLTSQQSAQSNKTDRQLPTGEDVMFAHMTRVKLSTLHQVAYDESVHPSVVRLGVRLACASGGGSHTPCGASASVVAVLAAIADMMHDLKPRPARRRLSRHLADALATVQRHLARCCVVAPAVDNVLRRLEHVVHTDIHDHFSDQQARDHIVNWIDSFVEDNVCKAMTAIAAFASEKVHDGDVVLTYGMCALVLDVLLKARADGRQFRVTVLDRHSAAGHDGGDEGGGGGRRMMHALHQAGVMCTYGLLASVSLHIHECSKVLIGVEAMLSDGAALCVSGGALLCLTAHAHNRAVLVCCETFKFSERVLTDPLDFNQLSCGMVDDGLMTDDEVAVMPRVVSTCYDVARPELVSVVVTELGTLPCTSVPAVLRLQAPSNRVV